jgi:hypothetical protein
MWGFYRGSDGVTTPGVAAGVSSDAGNRVRKRAGDDGSVTEYA